MTDRESIVAFIKQKIEAADTVSIVACQNLLAEIERCADLKPAKPKATIADLLALHDLDLGALAHKVGVTGDGFTTAQADALCGAYTADDEDRFDMVFGLARRSESVPAEACREIATRGALLRAALSAPTIKVSTPRVLQHDSAAEARIDAAMSGLSAADAIAWCEARDKACATHDAAVIDRLQRDGDSLRSLLAVIRHALGAGDHDDIVKHARAIKARADRA